MEGSHLCPLIAPEIDSKKSSRGCADGLKLEEPEDVRVVGDSEGLKNQLWVDPLGDYISENPPEIHVGQFLKARGQTDVEILVTYGEGKVTHYQGHVSF